jgi:adenylyltransferase/sulfurtransferase
LRRVLVIGAGGLGCPVAFALAPHVRLTIVDDDRVDVSNLQRQILHRTADVTKPKVSSIGEALRRRWPGATMDQIETRFDRSNAAALIHGHDLVLDCTDSFEAKFLLNDECLAQGVPLVHGGVVGWSGQVMSIARGHACFRCIFEAPPPPGATPSCQEAGVLGAMCGVIAGRMSREALAVLEGRPSLLGALAIYNGLSDGWRRIAPRLRPGCTAHSAAEVATW